MNLALSLFAVYAVGKAYAVWAHGFDLRLSSPFVLLWQDALCAAAVGAVRTLSRPAGWGLYGAAVLHFAASMPLLRLMASPLTLPLARGAEGALADSIRHHVDGPNIALMALTLLAGAVLPFLMKRSRTPAPAVLTAFVAIGLAGALATPGSDLQGLHRNSSAAWITGLIRTPAPLHRRNEVWKRAEEEPFSDRGAFRGWNVVLVALESTGARPLGLYGAGRDPMPFLAELGRTGVVFENAYAAYPESVKGLLNVIASRMPVFDLAPEDFGRLAAPSLATACGSAGYETALFHSGRFMYLGMDELVRNAGFDVAEDAGAIGGDHDSSFGVDDFSTVDRILEWLEKREDGRPFFLHYIPIAGHHPYDVPIQEALESEDDPSRYRNALHYSDLALKRLIDGLRSKGLLSRTLVVVYGDHGEAFGEHPGNFGHVLFLYEENLHVPLVFWAQDEGSLRPGRIQRIISLVDLAPTLCDLLGLPVPSEFEGLSALSPREQPAVFATDYSMRLCGARFDRWKFVYERDTGYVRLYDLEADPDERTNLAAAHPEVRRAFLESFGWSSRGHDPKLGL